MSFHSRFCPSKILLEMHSGLTHDVCLLDLDFALDGQGQLTPALLAYLEILWVQK